MVKTLQSEFAFRVSTLEPGQGTPTAGTSDINTRYVDIHLPSDQLVAASTGQDALISLYPATPYQDTCWMTDAALAAGVKRFISNEFLYNTCPTARELVPTYRERAKSLAYLKVRGQESNGLTWTAIRSGLIFEAIANEYLGFHLHERIATMIDSGKNLWSATTIPMLARAAAKVLLMQEQTKNRPAHVASFTVTQTQVLAAFQQSTRVSWKVYKRDSRAVLDAAHYLRRYGRDEALPKFIQVLLYANEIDRGANLERGGLLDNDPLDLPAENMEAVVERMVREPIENPEWLPTMMRG